MNERPGARGGGGGRPAAGRGGGGGAARGGAGGLGYRSRLPGAAVPSGLPALLTGSPRLGEALGEGAPGRAPRASRGRRRWRLGGACLVRGGAAWSGGCCLRRVLPGRGPLTPRTGDEGGRDE